MVQREIDWAVDVLGTVYFSIGVYLYGLLGLGLGRDFFKGQATIEQEDN